MQKGLSVLANTRKLSSLIFLSPRARAHVPRSKRWYLKASGGKFFIAVLLTALVMMQAVNVGNNFWLAFWTQGSYNLGNNVYL